MVARCPLCEPQHLYVFRLNAILTESVMTARLSVYVSLLDLPCCSFGEVNLQEVL